MKITTTLVHNDKGTTKIVAKAAGKQRTINYDHGVSHDYNHGTAAAALLTSGKFDGLLLSLTDEMLDKAVHDSNDSGTVHVFVI